MTSEELRKHRFGAFYDMICAYEERDEKNYVDAWQELRCLGFNVTAKNPSAVPATRATAKALLYELDMALASSIDVPMDDVPEKQRPVFTALNRLRAHRGRILT